MGKKATKARGVVKAPRKPRPSELKKQAERAAAKAKKTVKDTYPAEVIAHRVMGKSTRAAPVPRQHVSSRKHDPVDEVVEAKVAETVVKTTIPNVQKPGAPNNGIVKVFGRSAQRGGKVAGGIKLSRGTGRQVTITLTELQADAIAGLATVNHISFTEQVRQLINVAFAAT